jgi:hypothetical protein
MVGEPVSAGRAHMAVIGSSFLFIARIASGPARVGHARHSDAVAGRDGRTGIAPGLLRRMPPLRMLGVVFALNLMLALALPLLPVGLVALAGVVGWDRRDHGGGFHAAARGAGAEA